MPPRRPVSPEERPVSTAPLPQRKAAKTSPLTQTSQLRLPPSRRRKAMRVRNWLRLCTAAGIALGVLVTTAVGGAYAFLQGLGGKGDARFSPQDFAQSFLPLAGRRNVLLMGTDFSYAEGHRLAGGPVRADTLIVASLDPVGHRVNLVSIPRDTRVMVRGHYDKVNSALAMGGPELATEVVSSLLGVPITRWAQVNTTGLEKLVDVIGGVRVYAEKDMYYVDETAHLGINIHKGWHQMSGKQAHQFVRFRHDELGDIGRVQRQQQFLRAGIETLLTPQALLKLPQLMETTKQNITTNLGGSEVLRMAAFGAQLSRDHVKMVMLPGEFSATGQFGASYWLVDPQVATGLGKRLLTDGEVAEGPSRSRVKLTVLNGTPHASVASNAARALRAEGWNVWSVGDAAQRDVARTRLINQTGQEGILAPLASDLHVKPEQVDASVGDLTTDITVIVGEDWAKSQGAAGAPIADRP